MLTACGHNSRNAEMMDASRAHRHWQKCERAIQINGGRRGRDSLVAQADHVRSPKCLLYRVYFGGFGCLPRLQVFDEKDLVSLLVVNEFVH